MRRATVLFHLALLAACASAPPRDARWHPVSLPGKLPTHYAWTTKEGRPALAATADSSASLWRRRVDLPPDRLGVVEFSWWVQDLLPGANLAEPGRGDAPARVVFAFDGDHSRLSGRDRMLFDLAQALTGERPPYATLMYVYASSVEVDRVVTHPRTGRIRKIVLDSGATELKRWRDHRRDLAADYRRAFGEPPGVLLSVAVMTDTDNTRSRAKTWYGPIEFR